LKKVGNKGPHKAAPANGHEKAPRSSARKSAVTSTDVARLAGVSQAAVSRAFNKGAYISRGMREKVLKAARELGYIPNAFARSLTTQRSDIIAIVMSDMGNPVYPPILAAFNRRFSEAGRQVFLIAPDEDSGYRNNLAQVLQYRVAGVVITAASSVEFSKEIAKTCLDLNIPAVLYNRVIRGVPVSSVNCDGASGGQMAADLLIDAGCQRPAIITGVIKSSMNRERERGFVKRVQERGIERPLKQSSRFHLEDGGRAARDLLSGPDRPDGIYCVNDFLALGALEVARGEFGLRIPEDLGIIGFDDVPASSWPSFKLTSIRQRSEQMVNEVVDILLEHIEHPDTPPTTRRVPVDLIPRKTTKIPEY
jgi:DNA-binding LacI/PurR family transcriptional regulator